MSDNLIRCFYYTMNNTMVLERNNHTVSSFIVYNQDIYVPSDIPSLFKRILLLEKGLIYVDSKLYNPLKESFICHPWDNFTNTYTNKDDTECFNFLFH